MKEEEILHKLTDGRENPFRTPEGYFDQFTSRLMERLPEQPARRHGLRLIPRVWRYAAAVVLVGGIGLALYLGQSHEQKEYASSEQQEYSSEYMNDALDYALIDNNDIASYLTDAE